MAGSGDALPLGVPIQALDRTCEHVEDVGLRLDEAKAILHGLQEQLIRQQLAGYLDAAGSYDPVSESFCFT